MDIKPGTKVELKSGTKGKVMGQLQDGNYMVKLNRTGGILYCREKDIVSVEKQRRTL